MRESRSLRRLLRRLCDAGSGWSERRYGCYGCYRADRCYRADGTCRTFGRRYRTHRTDRTHRAYRTDRAHRSDGTYRADWAHRSNGTDRTDRTDRAHRSNGTYRTYRTDRGDGTYRGDGTDRTDRAHRTDGTHRSHRGDRRDRTFGRSDGGRGRGRRVDDGNGGGCGDDAQLASGFPACGGHFAKLKFFREGIPYGIPSVCPISGIGKRSGPGRAAVFAGREKCRLL